MRISIIVPTLDEQRTLASALEQLCALSDDVIVSDGGSRDGTAEIAARFPVRWVAGPAGRGRQLNAGARLATGDALLFVHADTRLPEGALERIRSAFDEGCGGGGFTVRFSGARRLMALGSRLVNLRTRVTKAPLGDQAQFVRRDIFEKLGGFEDWPILEDLDFIRRLRKRTRIAVIDRPVETSDRRYDQRGVFRTVALNWLIWTLHLMGVNPDRLAQLYREVR